MQFTLKSALKTHPGLTQRFRTGKKAAELPTGNMSAPVLFTSTFMSSMTGDFFFEIGKAEIDPVKHTRLLFQHARDTRRPVTELVDEYLNTLMQLGYDSAHFRKLVASIAGTNNRPMRADNVPQVTPRFILEEVIRLGLSVNEVINHMVADFVASMFRKIGWVISDAPVIYRVRSRELFPDFDSLVDSLAAKEASRVLSILADSDLSLVATIMREKQSVQPAMIAQHLSYAVVTAYETTNGRYDASEMVVSALTVLGRLWAPDTPVDLQPSRELQGAPELSKMKANLALFFAYQDMVAAKKMKPAVSFDDHTMKSTVFPELMQALTEMSPYKEHLLSDTIAFFGKKSARDYMGNPGQVILYEDWDFSSDASAFVPVRHSSDSRARFLVEQTAISTALETAMKPIRTALNLKHLVDRRVDSFELTSSANQLPAGGCEMIFGFPSLKQREVEGNYDLDAVARAVKTGQINEKDADGSLASIAYDYYVILGHLAVSKTPNTRIAMSPSESSAAAVPYLIFNTRTELKQPIASSAIANGEVSTTEPLEILAYVPDFDAASALSVTTLPLDKHKDGVHLWDYKSASEELNLTCVYSATIKNKTYSVTVDEHELLGLGVRRRSVLYMKPTVAVALTRLWFDWLVEEEKYLEAQARATKDTIVTTAIEGRLIQNSIGLARTLMRMGSTGAGSNAARFAIDRITDEMFDQGLIDDSTELHVGIQRHRLAIWAGWATMQVTGLIDAGEASKMIDMIVRRNALTLIIGTMEE